MEMKNIFQIFISNNDTLSNVSPQIMDKIEKVKSVYSDYNHTLYSNSMIQDFLSDFDKETLNSYNSFKPYAFKADLARYCLLYEYGGWYFDLSLTPEFKLEFDNSVDALMFKNHKNGYIENCVLYFKPKSQYLMSCIEQVNFHVLRKYYGKLSIHVSGPGVLQRIYDKYDKDYFNNYKIADFVDLSVDQWVCKYDNELFAKFKFPYTRGLGHLGAKGVNIYEIMWKKNDVYEY